jgi:uncharacterized membrane protein YuzA (DUF378 family)
MNVIQTQIAYFKQNPLDKLVQLLLIVGAINWGLLAYNGTDIVRLLSNVVGYTPLDRYLKLAVGIAGIYMLYKFVMPMTMTITMPINKPTV